MEQKVTGPPGLKRLSPVEKHLKNLQPFAKNRLPRYSTATLQC